MHGVSSQVGLEDYLGMLRIGDWIRFYPFVPLGGALLAGANPVQAALVLVIYLALIGYAFVVNNYFDVDIDRLHSGKVESNKNPLATGAATKRGTEAMMAILICMAFLSLTMTPLGACLVSLNLVLFTAYSASRIRLKERPVLDIVTHGLMFGAVPFLAGYALCQGSLSQSAIWTSSLFFILGAEALICHQVVEYKMDLGSSKTTVTEIGQRQGLILLGILTLASVILLLNIAQRQYLPTWAVAVAGWYLLAYPAYSCRSVYNDIRYSASIE